jgi:hypothetical protein
LVLQCQFFNAPVELSDLVIRDSQLFVLGLHQVLVFVDVRYLEPSPEILEGGSIFRLFLVFFREKNTPNGNFSLPTVGRRFASLGAIWVSRFLVP